MSLHKISKSVHFTSTVWFMASVGYMLIAALLEAGQSWWVIISVSGYSTLMLLVLMSLYLFAMYRGLARSQKIEIEHPLTSSEHYRFFYDISPFLGAVAGALGAIGVRKVSHFMLVTAAGSLWVTFLVWVIIDPVAGLVEMLLPLSRKHHRERLAKTKETNEQQRLAQQRLLAQLELQDIQQREHWNHVLRHDAEELASLIAEDNIASEQKETSAIEIGAKAWQKGGVNCMRQLHSMAMELCGQRCPDNHIVDYISIWWDGIGSWRHDPAQGKMELLMEGKGILCRV